MSDLDTQYCINSAYEKRLVDRGFHSDNPATTDMITIRKRCLGEDPYDDRAPRTNREPLKDGWGPTAPCATSLLECAVRSTRDRSLTSSNRWLPRKCANLRMRAIRTKCYRLLVVDHCAVIAPSRHQAV